MMILVYRDGLKAIYDMINHMYDDVGISAAIYDMINYMYDDVGIPRWSQRLFTT